MVPAGAPNRCDRRSAVAELLEEGDLVIDGGNNPLHRRSASRAAAEREGHSLADVGVSGGVGAERGYALMAGGSLVDCERALPILRLGSREGEDGLFSQDL